MASIDDLLAQLPIGRIAEMLGVDEATAANATRAAVPALVQGMQANAQDDARAQSLAQAIAQHAQRVASGAAADDDVDAVDTDDGARIVSHVFGDNEDQVVNQLGGLGGGGDLFKKLLPMLAPLVMGFLAKQFTNRGGSESSASVQQQDSGGGLGDLLGGLVGGGGRRRSRRPARRPARRLAAAATGTAVAAASVTCSAASSAVVDADRSRPDRRSVRARASARYCRHRIQRARGTIRMDRRAFLTKSGAAAGLGLAGATGLDTVVRAGGGERARLSDLPDLEWDMPTSWPAAPRHDLRRRGGVRRGGRPADRRQVRHLTGAEAASSCRGPRCSRTSSPARTRSGTRRRTTTSVWRRGPRSAPRCRSGSTPGSRTPGSTRAAASRCCRGCTPTPSVSSSSRRATPAVRWAAGSRNRSRMSAASRGSTCASLASVAR